MTMMTTPTLTRSCAGPTLSTKQALRLTWIMMVFATPWTTTWTEMTWTTKTTRHLKILNVGDRAVALMKAPTILTKVQTTMTGHASR